MPRLTSDELMRRYPDLFEQGIVVSHDYSSDFREICARCGGYQPPMAIDVSLKLSDGDPLWLGHVYVCRDYAACERRRLAHG